LVDSTKKRLLGIGPVKLQRIGLETGIVSEGWSPAEYPEDEVILQLGDGFGKREKIPTDEIVRLIGMSDPSIVTIGLNSVADFKCEMIGNPFSEIRNENEWYDIESISEKIPESWSCLIVNREDGIGSNYGIFNHLEILRRSGKIVVTEAEDTGQHSVALRIAEVVRGNIRVEHVNVTRKRSMAIAIIEPAPAVRTPKPLKYPDVTGILPSGMRIPPPEGVANDFSSILERERECMRDWSPSLPISIVIPVFNRAEILSKTLAMICHQTYPLDLIEVVIADDGSKEDILSVVNLFRDRLKITYVNQEDQGFRAAAARNMGIRSSSHNHIILLDADVAPVPTLVEVYARHFEVSSRSLFCGHRRYVDANMIETSDVVKSPSPMLGLPDIVSQNEIFKKDGHVLDWRMGMYRQSDNLRFEKYPFRAVCSGNLGFHISVFERSGGFDEEFRAWGKEDTEWGFRVWNRGEYIVPLYEACGLHQEPKGGRNETDRELGLEEVMPIFIDRVPVLYRKPEHGIEHSVPLVSIYIPAYNAEESIVETVKSALEQSIEDLEVCIAIDGSDDGTLRKLEENFIGNPRVRWVHQENQGIGGASNSAVQLCRGVFIGQLDSDDILLSDAVEILLEEIQKDTRLGVVYGSFQKETPEGEFLEDGYDWPKFSREKLMFGCIVHHFRLFRARDWWRTDGFARDLTNAVDYDMFLKMSNVTEIKHVPEWTYVYRIHDSSTSIRQRETQIRNHFVVLKRHLNRIGMGRKWEPRSLSKENPRSVKYHKNKFEQPKSTALPFSKMHAAMREAAPPIVKRLAEMESSQRPWTIDDFPRERFFERAVAYSKKKRVDISEEEIRDIQRIYGHNLWRMLESIDGFGVN
jgi:chondroitin synthase